MASIVQTVTLAPAFMQEIKEDDCRLKQLLREFQHLVVGCPLSPAAGLRLAALVSDLRDRIAFRFALEEAYGYFEDPVAVAPRLSERVEQLQSEHGKLFVDACRMVDVFENSKPGLPGDLAGVQKMCSDFLRRFQTHEAAEDALIVQAFHEDIGVGD